jgi:hypothetical protein
VKDHDDREHETLSRADVSGCCCCGVVVVPANAAARPALPLYLLPNHLPPASLSLAAAQEDTKIGSAGEVIAATRAGFARWAAWRSGILATWTGLTWTGLDWVGATLLY